MSSALNKNGIPHGPKPAPASALAHDIWMDLPQAVMIVDANNMIEAFNPSAASLWRERLDRSLGFFKFVAQDHPLANAVVKTRQGNSIHLHDIEINDTPIQDAAVRALPENRVMIVLTIASPHIAQMHRIRTAESMATAQHMARTLAHEIKNPLAGILGAAQLLGKNDLANEDRELVDLIAAQTTRIQRLVDSAAAIDTDNGHLAHEDININAVCNDVIGLCRAENAQSAEFEARYDPSLPPVKGIGDRIAQAILNICRNAAEAQASQIVITTGFNATAALYHPQRHVKLPIFIRIEDNGTGVDVHMRHKIFDPYYTTKLSGTGLGLAVVAKIIDDHGGIIDLASVRGKTVFTICLPLPAKKGINK